MNRETYYVIDYFKQHPEFLDAIKSLSFSDTIQYIKKNLDLKEDIELTQVQWNLFYTALSNINWNMVLAELKK